MQQLERRAETEDAMESKRHLGSIPSRRQASTDRGLVGSRLVALGSADKLKTQSDSSLETLLLAALESAERIVGEATAASHKLTVCPVNDVRDGDFHTLPFERLCLQRQGTVTPW